EDAPYFQAAYDELPLFNAFNYPKGAVIATILWSGHNSSGAPVAPFYPPDVYDYYNQTMPTGEPHATVYGAPINGAPSPGPSAGYDVSEANVENTLDLEMVGSTAPGSTIYNVYGPSKMVAEEDSAFSYVLNPSNTPGLQNVEVISNSWGAGDMNDSVWYNDLQEAQARGITVLAASGDTGDNPANRNWPGTDAEFPSSMAYSNFGVTAVGGTTLTLNVNSSSPYYLHITSQVAWYDPKNLTGSSGGISLVFPEPTWQMWSEANNIIEGAGRGVPDIAAVANNTFMTITLNGLQYSDELVGGTSIACPVEAGIVASMDTVLVGSQQPRLGFLNPLVYALGTEEYDYRLPSPPLDNVTSGRNFQYSALIGYDFVTGWGSIDATNFTMLVLSHYVPTISSFVAIPPNFPVGDTTVLDVTSQGGQGTVTYAYTGLPKGCTSADVSTLICTPARSGTFAVQVYVNDSAGHSAYATTSFTVTPPIIVSVALSPQTSYVVEGRSQEYIAAPTCNVGACPSGVGYAWALSNGLGTLNQTNGLSVNFTAGNANGTVELVVSATLNSVFKQSKPATITIVAPPSPPLKQVGNVGNNSVDSYVWFAVAIGLIVATVIILLVVILRRKDGPTERENVSRSEGILTPPEIPCPYCGVIVGLYSNYCNYCGAMLSREDQPAPTDPQDE
ncbi:MAG: hypothetical protein JRN35_10750, partial [Nitrososphaerota archaeon]|nr:hypothetical protein [Nitrososphaerota archaeon]